MKQKLTEVERKARYDKLLKEYEVLYDKRDKLTKKIDERMMELSIGMMQLRKPKKPAQR